MKPPLNHMMINADGLADEFNTILGLRTSHSGIVTGDDDMAVLGLPKFKHNFTLFRAFFDDFFTVAMGDAQGSGSSGTPGGGGAWFYTRASTTETAGAGAYSNGRLHMSCTTSANRITVKPNTRATTGAVSACIDMSETGTRFEVAAAISNNWGAAGGAKGGAFFIDQAQAAGWLVSGIATVNSGISFYFDGADLKCAFSSFVGSAQLDVDEVLVSGVGSGWYKCEALVTPLGSGNGFDVDWYVDGALIRSDTGVGAGSSAVALSSMFELYSTTASSRTIGVDYIYAAQELSAAR